MSTTESKPEGIGATSGHVEQERPQPGSGRLTRQDLEQYREQYREQCRRETVERCAAAREELGREMARQFEAFKQWVTEQIEAVGRPRQSPLTREEVLRLRQRLRLKQ